jgi:prevent-host-death family protein
MKTINFTKFRKKASGLITEVEEGEELVLIRHGKPVAEIIPYRKPVKIQHLAKFLYFLFKNGNGLINFLQMCPKTQDGQPDIKLSVYNR